MKNKTTTAIQKSRDETSVFFKVENPKLLNILMELSKTKSDSNKDQIDALSAYKTITTSQKDILSGLIEDINKLDYYWRRERQDRTLISIEDVRDIIRKAMEE